MFSLLSKLLGRNSESKQNNIERKPLQQDKLPASLDKKLKMLKPYLQKNQDIVVRPFYVQGDPELKAYAIHLEGIVDNISFQQDILRPLMIYMRSEDIEKGGANYLVEQMYKSILTVAQIKKIEDFSRLINSIFDGFAVLIFDGIAEALVIDIRKVERRGIEEPDIERSIRGSKEGFVENLVVNVALIRHRLRDPHLVVEKTIVGKRTRTDVALLYIDDIADPEIVRNVREKINNIDIDGILGTAYLEQLLEDNHYSPFSQIRATERSDKTVMELLEGKVAVLSDGCPTVLLIPSLLVSFLQAPEDYIDRPLAGTVNRLFRYIAFIFAISLPALYISLLSFNPELIPLQLLVSLAQARNEVPFPVVVEVLIQELIIQLVIEAGIRLPGAVGQTVGVVAGIVLGQAAIAAKLGSPAIIIVNAITTISTFALPNQSLVLASRIIRMGMIILTAAFGIFGLSFGFLILLIHLISLESMGTPFLAPYAPMRYADLKDSLYRIFLARYKERPVSIPHQDTRRQGGQNGQ